MAAPVNLNHKQKSIHIRHFFSHLFTPFSRLGVRGRIFIYFLGFTITLLALLWVFQIALLSDFYRLQKTNMLTANLDVIENNINNEGLQLLVDRIAETNDISILIVNEYAEKQISSEMNSESIIARMSGYDVNRYITLAQNSDTTLYRIFDLSEGHKSDYNENRFSGPVPREDDGFSRSMVAIRSVVTDSGDTQYIFVSTIITPVDSTVQTLQSQFLFIAVFMIVLSFLLSLVLSRRIALPIIDTSEAAIGLSEGNFKPAKTSVSYREIQQLNATLIKAAKDLRRVDEMQRELIANISHDLRTPLTLIEGYAEAMRDLPGESTPENMQVIIDETRRLSSLVNAVLDYTAGKRGLTPIDPQRFNLTRSIQRILTRYQKLTGLEGYTVQFDHSDTVWVYADEMRIGQVVYNLINNALTYTGEDKLVIVRQIVEGSQVRVEIIDTGEGIPQEDLPNIWGRYYRGQKPHKRAAVGTGLGLSIVQGIFDAHHLDYGVTSTIGSGTTFWFTLNIETIVSQPGVLQEDADDTIE